MLLHHEVFGIIQCLQVGDVCYLFLQEIRHSLTKCQCVMILPLVDEMRVCICVCVPKDYDKILDDESEDRIVRVMRITAFED